MHDCDQKIVNVFTPGIIYDSRSSQNSSQILRFQRRILETFEFCYTFGNSELRGLVAQLRSWVFDRNLSVEVGDEHVKLAGLVARFPRSELPATTYGKLSALSGDERRASVHASSSPLIFQPQTTSMRFSAVICGFDL